MLDPGTAVDRWAPASGPPVARARPAAVAPRSAVPFLDVPCSMLVRDLAAVCGNGWRGGADRYTLVAPKGSHAVVAGPGSDAVVALLRAAGPKVLQAFALALDLWTADTGGRDPSAVAVRPLADFAAELASGGSWGRGRAGVRDLLRTLACLGFDGGPWAGDAGPPLVLHDAGDDGRVAFSPGAAWVRGLAGPAHRVARLPRSFLSLHARNDRYRILLSWYLAIMLRVNRKHGFRYRVGLGTLLEGAGVTVPDRNVSRFLAAVLRALDDIPGVRVRAPLPTLYDPAALLATMVDVSLDPALLAAYAS